MRPRRRQTGYILLPVVVIIAVVAAVALIMNYESSFETSTTSRSQDRQQAQYVAEAGLNHGLWQVQQQGCSGYTDLTGISFGSDQYSTTLTTDLAITTNYSISLDQDGWIRSDDTNKPNPTDSKLHIKLDAGKIERPVYRYDLSALAVNTPIISAVAWFFVSGEHPAGPVEIHALNADWTEASATWDLLGDRMDGSVLATIPAQPVKDVWVSVNLTGQVQAWVNGLPNYGIAMNPTGEGDHGDYASRESANVPFLELIVGDPPSSPATLKSVGTLASGVSRTITRNDVVLYQRPPGIRHLQPDAADGEDAEIWAQSPDNNYGNAAETWVSSASNDTTRSLLRFDTGTIPVGAKILQATLSLERQSGAGADQPVSVYRIMNSWHENSVTWNWRYTGKNWDSGGVDFDNTAVATTLVGPVNQRYSWDIKPLVQSWVDGSDPNYGVVLVAGTAGMAGERFYTSDHADYSRWPSLSVSYTCECGSVCVAPQGNSKIAMIGNYVGLFADSRDLEKEAIIESWGYQVDQYDDNFIWLLNDSNYDLIYVSETASSAAITGQLDYRSIGIVSEEGGLNNEFGLSTGHSAFSGNAIDIVDNSHYVTAPFTSGSLQIYDHSMEILTATGSKAPDLHTLAEQGSEASLILIEQGGTTLAGPAAGKRVVLPLGRANVGGFNWNFLNNNGRMLVQRAIEWGIGNSDGPSAPIFLATEGNAGLGGLNFTDKDLVEYDPDADSASLFLDGSAVGLAQDIDAVHVLANGQILLSTINTITFGGVTAQNEDLIAYDAVNDVVTMYFDGSTVFNAGQTDISAVHVMGNGHLLLTNEYDATLGGLAFETNDIVEYDPASGGATLFFDGDAVGFNGMIDALYQLPNGHLVMSTLTDDSLGGLNFKRDDLIEYDPVADTASIYFDNNLFDNNENIRALYIGAGSGSQVDKLPIAHWKLDETIGTIATDSIGGHDAVLNNGPVWVAQGQIEGALDFDGFDDHVVASHDSALSITDELTMMAWVYPRETGATFRILSKEQSGQNDGYWMAISGGSVFVGIGGQFYWYDIFALPNQWHHIAATYSDADDELKIYVDGSLMTTESASTPLNINTADVIIGDNWEGNKQWDGRLDDVRIYGQVLSDAEIALLAALPGPVAHWKLDETSGSIAVDSVGNNDGTLVNGPVWNTSGQIDGALDFDESNDYVQVADFAYGTDFSLSFGLKVDDNSGSLFQYIFSHGDINGFDSLNIFLKEATHGTVPNMLRTVMRDSNDSLSNTALEFDVSSIVGDGNWHTYTLTVVSGMGTKVYLDGVLQNSDTRGGEAFDPQTDLYLGARQDLNVDRLYGGSLDDVRLYDRALSNSEIADLIAKGGGSGASAYTEKNDEWSAGSSDTWETVDLSGFGVPPDAVVEVAINNFNTSAERWGGVRAVGSSLDRRLQLHEAEGGGIDAVVMHVQANSSGQIEHYSDNTSDVEFTLLGYWTGASYVELFDRFSANDDGWKSHNFGNEGVAAGQVAEIVLANTSTSREALAGLRATGSSIQRRFELHEAESGGVDTVTLFVQTDASARAEVYAPDDDDLDVYVVGYWSTPPGTYTETGGVSDQVSSTNWETVDLGSFGVPAGSVAQFVLANDYSNRENQIGVRATGSALNRRLDLQEAESGGSDQASMHVSVDTNAEVEWAAEQGANDGFFYPVGWWVLAP